MEDIRLSYSIASTLIDKSPSHAYLEHRLLGGQKKFGSKAMDEGRIFECILMGHDESFIEVLNFSDYKTNAAKEAKKESILNGKTPILGHVYDQMVENIPEIKEKLLSKGIDFSIGEKKKRIEWESNGVKRSGEIDWFFIGNKILIKDLKRTSDASPYALQKHIPDMNYDLQAANYIDYAETTFPEFAGRIEFELDFVEDKGPICITPVKISNQMLWLGQSKMRRADNIWKKCLSENVWPDYTTGAILLDPPTFLIKKEEELQLTGCE